jgi:hypothetical protein
MDAKQIAAAARELSTELNLSGSREQWLIADAFEKFADLIDRAATN